MKKFEKIALIVLAAINLGAQVFIYLLHADYLDTIGIEAIDELGVTPIALGVLLILAVLFTYRCQKVCVKFLAFSGLALTIYIAATHSGYRSAVSLLDRPQYIVGILALAALLSVFGMSKR